MTNESCIFCRIAAGREEASMVYQDNDVAAFLDTLPINAGHTLVVPRHHATFLADLSPEDGVAVFRAAQRISAALRKSGLKCEATNLLLNDGAEAGQRVFHVHLHVIPRFVGDGSRLRRTDGDIPERHQLDEVAARIKAALAALA
jgi:diadenosine tetraphosphate (Ap4A) HIT family hydrolase